MLFDSTVRKELTQNFGVTVVIIVTVVLTLTLISTLGRAAGGTIAPQDVVLILGYSSLSYLAMMLTLSLYLAIVLTLGRMYRESEMSIWFASGLPLTRFIKPVLQMAAPWILVVLVLQLIVTPWGNQSSEQLRDRYEKRSDLSRVAPGQFQTSRDGSRVFFIDRDSEDARTGRNVFILGQDPKHESVTTSSRGHIQLQDSDRFLILDKGQRNETDLANGSKTLARFDQYKVLIDSHVERTADTVAPKAMTTLQLLNALTPRNAGELTWRIGWIFTSLNMVLLGVSLSATNPRRASSWTWLFALLGFIVYFNLMNLSMGWVSNQRMSWTGALAALHGSAFVLAIALMWLRDQRNRFRPNFKRHHAA